MFSRLSSLFLLSLLLVATGQVSATSLGGGWIEWAPGDTPDTLDLTVYLHTRDSFYNANPNWVRGRVFAARDGGSHVSQGFQLFQTQWAPDPTADPGLSMPDPFSRYGRFRDVRFGIGTLSLGNVAGVSVDAYWRECCRYATTLERNNSNFQQFGISLPADTAMWTASPRVFRPQLGGMPRPAAGPDLPARTWGTLETDAFAPGTLLSATPGMFTVTEGQPITFHTGILLPEADALGRPLDWLYRYAPLLELDTQIPGTTRNSPLLLNQDGTMTWVDPPDIGGSPYAEYQTRIEAVEQGSGTVFSYDILVQVLPSGTDLDVFYYETAQPQSTAAVPIGGIGLVFLLAAIALAARRALA